MWSGAILTAFTLLAASGAEAKAQKALAYGRGGCGKLEGGLALPCRGTHFEAHSDLACTLGRNYLHPRVRDTLIDAFASLSKQMPDRTWQYGEMGKKSGGSFWPHKTHQNGLSADIFMPMVDAAGAPAKLPISALDRFGYDLELDAHGRLGALKLDGRALGALLLALDAAGAAHGARIVRIIVTPDFHAELFRVAPELAPLAPRFMKKEAWVRHDEHVHVDFEIPRAERRPLSCR